MREINEIVVHCSASDSILYDFEAIKKDHVMNRGWDDIGYHYGVNFAGKVEVLRPVDVAGAHVRGRNDKTIGVCLLGKNKFTEEQFIQAGKLVESLCLLLDLKRQDIRGHYEFSNKTCPGFDIDWFRDNYCMRVEWRNN